MHLSPREVQVIRLIHGELMDKEIAHQLGIKVGTTKVYIARLKMKMGIRSRIGMALWWERKIKTPHRVDVH